MRLTISKTILSQISCFKFVYIPIFSKPTEYTESIHGKRSYFSKVLSLPMESHYITKFLFLL